MPVVLTCYTEENDSFIETCCYKTPVMFIG